MPASLALVLCLLAPPVPARTEQAGWIQLKVSGTPAEIGSQVGEALADEIEDAHLALRVYLRGSTGKDWDTFRTAARDVLWPQVPQEYRQEMQAQAEALARKGKKLDLWDVVAFNGHIEIEGYYLPWKEAQRTGREVSRAKDACSAFVATGSATKDGRPVIGHNLWWDYMMGQRFRVVLDVRPTKGQRFVMDGLPGFIHSGSDWAINAAGIALCETTISGFFGFDPKGVPEFVRMRKAIQYGTTLDEVYQHFVEGNNGGYANTWLLADVKTNEIGKLELGLKNVIFHRSKTGWYVGSNFAEDPKLIEEETRGVSPDPAQNGTLRRRARWETLMRQNRGQIDAARAKTFLADTFDEVLNRRGASSSTLCGRDDEGLHGATNTKVADAEMIRSMRFWGRMGFSDGGSFRAADWLARRPNSAFRPFLRDIPSQPWVMLGE